MEPTRRRKRTKKKRMPRVSRRADVAAVLAKIVPYAACRRAERVQQRRKEADETLNKEIKRKVCRYMIACVCVNVCMRAGVLLTRTIRANKRVCENCALRCMKREQQRRKEADEILHKEVE